MPSHLGLNIAPMNAVSVSERTRVKRHPERAVYNRAEIEAILDEGYICHVAFIVDGQPHLIPTAYGRLGDQIYIHGSAASHMLRSLAKGVDVCVTVTLVDGFVLARSSFRHSLNYRSVIVYGNARLVTDPREKMEALRCFTNHLVPGRWEQVRPPNEREMLQTSVLALGLEEAVAKARTGPPMDAEEDISASTWAGVIPLVTRPGQAVPDRHVVAETPVVDPGEWARFQGA
jgi:nitroimidazol reductase NimA-like FMN-containing flavoprotein (pyridoxamine 5'-phosphate oxidase superfamily)